MFGKPTTVAQAVAPMKKIIIDLKAVQKAKGLEANNKRTEAAGLVRSAADCSSEHDQAERLAAKFTEFLS